MIVALKQRCERSHLWCERAIQSRARSLGTGGDLLVREPRRPRTADLSKAKLSAVRSHPIVVLYGWCRFCTRSAAS